MSERKNCMSLEQGAGPQTATLDFLSFHPQEGLKVHGATVKVTLTYDKDKGTATLHVYAADNYDATILIDSEHELHVEEVEQTEEEETEE